MRGMTMKKAISMTRLTPVVIAAALLLTTTAYAAAPGITGPTFYLTAQAAYLNMPDGEAVYSWGYGCNGGPAGFLPAAITNPSCNSMQVPGPTLIVHEGDAVTVNLLNGLPAAAGNTSILFPGFQVTATGGVAGLLTQEATPGGTVTYTFTASAPGTHPYYSGTQGDLQIEMGLYGAIIVLPATVPVNCSSTSTTGGYHYLNAQAQLFWHESDFRLSQAAYDHPASCYDREYLFQWAEMDPRIHKQAEAEVADPARVAACAATTATKPGCSLDVQTEPYHPAYFLINGRSMPDLMDPNYAAEYPHQPYNGNPHIHPGELLLIRTVGQGRWQHPYHEHANHVRILARDGNLVLSSSATPLSYSTPGGTAASGRPLAGLLMFNTDTTPGQAFDGIFYFTGRGLNWDPYGHHPASASPSTLSTLTITAISQVGTTVTATVGGTLPTSVNNTTVVVAGVAPTGYNGTFTVTSVNPVTNQFTYTDSTTTPLSTGTGGTATINLGVTNVNPFPTDPLASLGCTADANGYNTGDPTAVNFFEWCQDHNKPVQANPFGDVASGGPATLPDPNILTNGAWYGGTPYLGPDASLRATMPACGTTAKANCTTLLPSNVQANPPNERGWAFMWHSHNEREITTNNIFPGGMLMMMLVDSREFVIDEGM